MTRSVPGKQSAYFNHGGIERIGSFKKGMHFGNLDNK